MVQLADCVSEVIQDAFIIASTNTFDTTWLAACRHYIDSLPIHDKYTLKSYTKHGDELVNAAMQGKWDDVETKLHALGLDFAAAQIFRMLRVTDANVYTNSYTLSDYGTHLLSDVCKEKLMDVRSNYYEPSTVRGIIKDYAEDLMRIIQRAPAFKKPVLVFRGVKHDYIDRRKPSAMSGFQSTSCIPDVAYQFKDCCIYEIIITPGTPCIAIESISHHRKECEILLGLNVQSQVGELHKKPFFDTTHLNYKHDGTSYTFTEPTYLLKQFMEPWNKEHEQIPVRKLITIPTINHRSRGGRSRHNARKSHGNRSNVMAVFSDGGIMVSRGYGLTEEEKERMRQISVEFNIDMRKYGLQL